MERENTEAAVARTKWGSRHTKAAIARTIERRRTGGRGRAGRWAGRKLGGHGQHQVSGSDGIWPIARVSPSCCKRTGGNKWGAAKGNKNLHRRRRKQASKGQQKLAGGQTGGLASGQEGRLGGQVRRVPERTSEPDGLESWRAGVSGRSTPV